MWVPSCWAFWKKCHKSYIKSGDLYEIHMYNISTSMTSSLPHGHIFHPPVYAIGHVCHHVGFTIISMQYSVQVSSLYCGCAWLYSISCFCFVYMWLRMRVSNYLNLRGHLVQQGVVHVYNVLHLVQQVI